MFDSILDTPKIIPKMTPEMTPRSPSWYLPLRQLC